MSGSLEKSYKRQYPKESAIIGMMRIMFNLFKDRSIQRIEIASWLICIFCLVVGNSNNNKIRGLISPI